MVDINSADNIASFSLFNQGTISTTVNSADSRSNSSSGSYGFLGGASTDTPNIVGLGRIAAINIVNQLGLSYLLTYTAGTLSNNDTVSSSTVIDGVVHIVVYQYTNTGLTLDFSTMMSGFGSITNDADAGNAIKFRFGNTAANTAIAATPSPASNGWIGATFTINNPVAYMGDPVPSILTSGLTFTVAASSVETMPGMGTFLILTTSNTTSIGGMLPFLFNGTATVTLP